MNIFVQLVYYKPYETPLFWSDFLYDLWVIFHYVLRLYIKYFIYVHIYLCIRLCLNKLIVYISNISLKCILFVKDIPSAWTDFSYDLRFEKEILCNHKYMIITSIKKNIISSYLCIWFHIKYCAHVKENRWPEIFKVFFHIWTRFK